MVENLHIFLEICQRRHQAVTAPVGAGRRDDVVGLGGTQNATAAAALALALRCEGHVLFDMLGNRAHADLIAQVADGDVRHAVGTQDIPQNIAAGLQGGHIQTNGIVADAHRIRAAGFHRDDRRRLAGGQLVSLGRGGGDVLRKGDDAHAQRQGLHSV